MKIEVERVLDKDDQLVFTIKVSEPHAAPFTEDDLKVMRHLEEFGKIVESDATDLNEKLVQDIGQVTHYIRSKRYERIQKSLKFSIDNELAPKFKPMCVEIYNWLLDRQPQHLKGWMQEFDPQRETYYFDNDNDIDRAMERFQGEDLDSD